MHSIPQRKAINLLHYACKFNFVKQFRMIEHFSAGWLPQKKAGLLLPEPRIRQQAENSRHAPMQPGEEALVTTVIHREKTRTTWQEKRTEEERQERKKGQSPLGCLICPASLDTSSSPPRSNC